MGFVFGIIYGIIGFIFLLTVFFTIGTFLAIATLPIFLLITIIQYLSRKR